MYQMTETEYRFAELIWEEEPIGSGELVKQCAEKFGWKKSTTYTFIKKLCENGIFKNENAIVSSVPYEHLHWQSYPCWESEGNVHRNMT